MMVRDNTLINSIEDLDDLDIDFSKEYVLRKDGNKIKKRNFYNCYKIQ